MICKFVIPAYLICSSVKEQFFPLMKPNWFSLFLYESLVSCPGNLCLSQDHKDFLFNLLLEVFSFLVLRLDLGSLLCSLLHIVQSVDQSLFFNTDK